MLKLVKIWPALFLSWVGRTASRRDETGASLVEYALLLALIAVVAIGALVFLGHAVNNQLNHIANDINTNTGP
jgi:pilus assembly protein Flp/PilA